MINLTPKEERKKIKADFYLRLLIVFLFSVSLSFLVFDIAMVPSYYGAKVFKDAIDQKLLEQKNTPVPALDIETQTIIQNINSRVKLIKDKAQNNFLVSDRVINQILLKKMPDIKITSIVYFSDNELSKKIQITGSAPSRERLLLFRIALEENTLFKSVDLPISNFIKGSNIIFSLTLVPA